MMKKLAISLSLAMTATLAAAAHDTVVVGPADPAYVASSGPVSGVAVRPGAGKVTYLTDLTGPVADVSSQRVTLRMDDGTLQTVFVRGEQLKMGESIRIRPDNSIRREPSA